MTLLLALDCSTEACSVALYTNDLSRPPGAGEVIAGQSVLAAREHTQQLLPMVERVLAEAGVGLGDVDACAFGRGPGSFTGLRIALGAIQGLAFGAQLPVVPVSTLAGLAQTRVDAAATPEAQANILAAIDARMGEVYWAVYRVMEGLVVEACPERLTAPQGITRQQIGADSSIIGVGSGWNYQSEMQLAGVQVLAEPEWLPAASAIARLADDLLRKGDSVTASDALPLYLREQVAWQKT